MKVTLTDAQRMLHLFGFLAPGKIGMPEDPDTKRAVAGFQAWKGQYETGNVRGPKFLAELFQMPSVTLATEITDGGNLSQGWWVGLQPNADGLLPEWWWAGRVQITSP